MICKHICLIFSFPRSCAKTATFQALMEIVDWQLKTDLNKISNSAQEYIISLHYLKLYMIGTVLDYRNLLVMYAAQDIISKLIDGITGVKKFYLNLVNYLNSERPEYQKHALYVTEDLEISEKEHRVVRSLDNDVKQSLLKYVHYNLRTTILENKERFFEDLDCCLPAFLVLRYYPCIIRNLQPCIQSTLDYLLKFCNCDNEELASAVISCISIFFKNLNVNGLRLLKYNNFIQILMELASPASSVHCRLATCDFFLENKTLFCSRDTGFSGMCKLP